MPMPTATPPWARAVVPVSKHVIPESNHFFQFMCANSSFSGIRFRVEAEDYAARKNLVKRKFLQEACHHFAAAA
jgi:hypothetical protein